MPSIPARIVIAIAAVASIATSVAPGELFETQPLEPVVVESGTTQTYAIQIRYADSDTSTPAGTITVLLDLRAGSGTSSSLTQVTLDRGDIRDGTGVDSVPNTTQTAELTLPAWQGCSATTECIEDYTLTIFNTGVLAPATGPSIEVSGTVDVDATHSGRTDPTITIEVTPLGPS